MKILLIGLDCAAPELLFGDSPALPHFRHLMDVGCYGKLESIIPPITVPAWMCMATSQDPGSLGVYGFRNRSDHTYGGLEIATSRSIREVAIWDTLAMEGKRSVIMGVPPSYPPRKVNGVSVSCFMTPDTTKNVFTHPPEITDEIREMVGEYPVDVSGFRTEKKDWLRDEIFRMSRTQFEVIRHYLQQESWDYFQFVDIGLDRVHHGFWQYHDPDHIHYEPGNPYENVIADYYLHLDNELGKVLELLDEETIVMIVSDHGAQRLDGGFCINEWLVNEGLLVLNSYPTEVTPFSELDVNWEKTKVWSEGGYYARMFFNVKGREPNGVIEQADYARFRDEIKARLEATVDHQGKSLGTLVFKPEEVYKSVRNVAPDLIVHLGKLYWRSIGGVGYPDIHIFENDTGPDGCNHAQFGGFILAASNNPLSGEIQGAHLLDVAPTLLDLGGYEIPDSMQGNSLVAGKKSDQTDSARSADDEALVRDRLKGLGYIS